MIKLKRESKGNYTVNKNGVQVARVEFIPAGTEWSDESHWALRRPSGRIDRHESFELARADALKI